MSGRAAPDATDAARASARLSLRIADIGIALSSAESDLHIALDGAAARFVRSEPQQPDISMIVKWGAPSCLDPARLVFDSGGVWQLHDVGGSYVFSCRSPRYGADPYKAAALDRTLSTGTIFLNPLTVDRHELQHPLEYPLDELIVTNWLALGRGVELHACGVRDEHGDGLLFIGHSGAGKSTMAALWNQRPGTTVLSDDRVIVRQVEGTYWIYGTPWHGDEPLSAPVGAPLTRIFFLAHGANNRLRAIDRVEASAKLFACSFTPFFSRAGIEFSLALVAGMSEQLPVAELAFVPNERVFPLLHTACRPLDLRD